MKLDADRIRFDIDRSIVTAQGSPVLQDGDQRVDGERMVYNVDEGQGTIYDGVTKYEQGICYGSKIHRLDDQTLLLQGGRYTSCEAENPHYYFRADRMKIYLDDEAVVRPIVLHIADIPLLALPYYLFPLKGGRSSGFLLPNIEFGFSESKGRFIRNGGYFWAVNEYADLTFRGDFFQNSHWIGYLDGRYRVRYLLSGSMRSSYQSSVGGRRRWSVQADHNQELGENLDLTMRANFVSDKLYRVEQSTTLQELDRTLKSDLVLKKRWKDMSFSGQVSRTEQLDRDRIDETVPSIQFTLNRRELVPPAESPRGERPARRWYNDIYYQYGSRLLNSRERVGDEREDRAGWDHDLSMNFSRRFGEWLGYSARAGWGETWYDRDKLGQRRARRGMWSASTSVNTNVYGTFFPRVGPLVGLRHIVSPGVSFSYRPKNPNHFYMENGVETDRFYNFGGFGPSQRSARSLSLSLDNKLQTKYLVGEEERKNDQLLILSNSVSYDFERDRDKGEKPWSDLSSSLRFQPVSFFNSEASVSHDTYGWAFRSFSMRSGIRLDGSLGPGSPPGAAPAPEEGITDGAALPDEGRSPFEDPVVEPYRGDYRDEGRRTRSSSVIPWNLQLSHSFSRGALRGNFTQWLNASLGLGLTSGWDVDYENRYDLEEKKTVSQGFRIRRDLHCWEASFRGRYSGREWEYYFNVRIRAHPEIYYEKGERRLGY
ncbi:MAG: LPS assembly protein LptD [Candidatus Eisenbacteria bacterium]